MTGKSKRQQFYRTNAFTKDLRFRKNLGKFVFGKKISDKSLSKIPIETGAQRKGIACSKEKYKVTIIIPIKTKLT